MRVCPLSLIGNNTENVRFCLLEDCMFFEDDCVIKTYFLGLVPNVDPKPDGKEIV